MHSTTAFTFIKPAVERPSRDGSSKEQLKQTSIKVQQLHLALQEEFDAADAWDGMPLTYVDLIATPNFEDLSIRIAPK